MVVTDSELTGSFLFPVPVSVEIEPIVIPWVLPVQAVRLRRERRQGLRPAQRSLMDHMRAVIEKCPVAPLLR
jgi:hypothetical protein